MTELTFSEVRDLIVALLDAAVDHDGGVIPTLPQGRHDTLVAVLTKFMIDRSFATFYLAPLEAESRRRNVYGALPGHGADTDYPLEQIELSGLTSVSDKHLVTLAIDPIGLSRVFDFIAAVLDGDSANGYWAEEEMRRLLAAAGVAPSQLVDPPQPPAPEPRLSGGERHNERGQALGHAASTSGYSPRLRLQGAVAIAASLLVALVVYTLWPHPGDNLFVTAEPGYMRVLDNSSPLPRPTVTSPINGYVTLVAASPTGGLSVWPTEGAQAAGPLAIDKGVSRAVGPLPQGTVAALVVVTEQPSTHEILQEVRRLEPSPDRMSQLEEQIRTRLRELNYRRIAFGTVAFESR